MALIVSSWFLALLIVLAGTVRAASAQTPEIIQAYDANGDLLYDQSELIALFLAEDGDIKAARAQNTPEEKLAAMAEDRAEDALTRACTVNCTTVTLAAVLGFLDDRAWGLGVTRQRIGWTGLEVRRFITDPADFKALPARSPAFFSYKRDNEAVDKDQVNVLGGVQIAKPQRAFGSSHYLTVAPGLEMAIDGSKPANESSIEVVAPTTYEFVRTGLPAVAGAMLTVTPKYLTDRDFERSGWELTLEGSVTSTAAARMGYVSWLGRQPDGGLSTALLSVFWRPSVRLETGEITDAAGNPRLLVLMEEGRYTRVTPRLAVTARPERWLPALNFSLDYFHRFNGPEGKSAGYGEVRMIYDLTKDRALSFGVVVARGSKPPDFAPINQVLVGFGLLQ
jgi:hypothetical protein